MASVAHALAADCEGSAQQQGPWEGWERPSNFLSPLSKECPLAKCERATTRNLEVRILFTGLTGQVPVTAGQATHLETAGVGVVLQGLLPSSTHAAGFCSPAALVDPRPRAQRL